MGTLANTVDDLEKLTEVVINYCNVNERMMPLPWKPSLCKLKKIGVIIEWDNFFELTLTNRRAMKMCIEKLQ